MKNSLIFDPETLIYDFGNVKKEIEACRNSAAIFDFSFITIFNLTGKGVTKLISIFASRDLQNMKIGQINYAIRCTANGRALSDLTIWRLDRFDYLVMSGRFEDFLELKNLVHHSGLSQIKISKKNFSTLALQGPHSLLKLKNVLNTEVLSRLKYYEFTKLPVFGINSFIGRLGYTGERGFEFLFPAEHFQTLWKQFSEIANPAGFAAINCLRIEAGFVLFCNEFFEGLTPLEVGFTKSNYKNLPEHPVTLVSFLAKVELTSSFWKPEAPLSRPLKPGTLYVTSACQNEKLGCVIGLGYINSSEHNLGSTFKGDPGLFGGMELISHPFYDPQKLKPRGSWHLNLLPL